MPAKQVGDKYPDRDMPLDSEALKRLVEEVENHEVSEQTCLPSVIIVPTIATTGEYYRISIATEAGHGSPEGCESL